MRLATWNLERPRRGSHRRIPGLHAQISAIGADVWVLTETNDDIVDLAATHPHHVSTTPISGLHHPSECCATIWSRFPLTVLATSDAEMATCARVATPGGPLLVYGTVLPYAGDPGRAGMAKGWAEFRRVLAVQRDDWRMLRARFPGDRRCVAGDLNQSLDERRWNGRQWCGTRGTRAALRGALTDAGLTCVTAHDLMAAGQLTTRSSIDHICLDDQSAAAPLRVGAWEAGRGDGVRLSDHNGVYVDLCWPEHHLC